MAVFYNKERAKYGHITGQVIVWPVTYEGTPDTANNITNLPAGYLKCDGSKYFAEDYPRLAAILGTGTNTAFMKKNLDGTDFESINDNQFMVPDLGSKYPEPTTGANAGVYNNIRKNDSLGSEKSRSGVGIDAEAAIGTTNVNITYSGSINVPAQEVEIKGKPGWTYAGDSHYTDVESVEENQIHPHMHFTKSAPRSRLRAAPTILEIDNDHPFPSGSTALKNGSTINITEWVNATRAQNSAANPPGSGQEPCKALSNWDPNDGVVGDGTPLFGTGLSQTIYYGGCIDDNVTGIYQIGSGQDFEFGCINLANMPLNRQTVAGSPNSSDTGKYQSKTQTVIGGCPGFLQANGPAGGNFTIPPTYVSGAVGMPVDFNNNQLTDVLPLQANESAVTQSSTPDVRNETTDTADLSIAAGTLPTAHSHRVRLDKGDHTYKVKTDAISIDPENLSTTFDIGVDSSISIDSASQPFIVMEYLIKI